MMISIKKTIILLLLFLSACTNNQQKPAADAAGSSQPVQLPEGFADFYQKFHSDSLYQAGHIVFPLEGLPDNADSLTIAGNDYRWLPENWKMQRQFDFEMSEYKREIVPLNENMVLERIVHQSGAFGMVRRFAKVGGEWHLIYYAGMNRLAK
jgi:hypothetical protein